MSHLFPSQILLQRSKALATVLLARTTLPSVPSEESHEPARRVVSSPATRLVKKEMLYGENLNKFSQNTSR